MPTKIIPIINLTNPAWTRLLLPRLHCMRTSKCIYFYLASFEELILSLQLGTRLPSSKNCIVLFWVYKHRLLHWVEQKRETRRRQSHTHHLRMILQREINWWGYLSFLDGTGRYQSIRFLIVFFFEVKAGGQATQPFEILRSYISWTVWSDLYYQHNATNLRP